MTSGVRRPIAACGLPVGVLAALGACLLFAPARGAEATPNIPTTPVKPAATPAITPTQAEADLAAKIETSLNTSDGKFVHQRWDYAAMAARVAGDAQLTADQRAALAQALSRNMNLGEVFASVVQMGPGSYKFKCVREVHGERRLCFRLLYGTGPNAGANIQEFLLAKNAAGDLCLVDSYSLATGQWWSEKTRRNFLKIVLAAEPALLQTLLTGAEAEYAEHDNLVKDFYAKVDARDWQAALDAFDQFPAVLKTDRNMLLNRIQVASHLGEDTYTKVFAASAPAFKNDPLTLEFIQGDWFIATAKYDRLLTFMDHLEQVYGLDAHYQEQRAAVYIAQDKFDLAKKAARTGLELEKDFIPLYIKLLEISIREKNYDDTLQWLTAFEKNTGRQMPDLTRYPVYAGFVAAPQFKQWQALHPAAPDAPRPADPQPGPEPRPAR